MPRDEQQEQLQEKTEKSASPNQPQVQVPSRDASRELDALVAEKVFGEKYELYPDGSVARVDGVRFRPLNVGPVGGPMQLVLGGPRPFSTDIAAAWLVVEKLNERFHARIDSPFEVGDDYFAGFTPHGTTGWNGRPDHRAGAATAPLAICRAALSAVVAP